MADENVNVIERRETTEVLGLDGKSTGPGNLANIFDRIEAGKSEGLTAKEVLKDAPQPKVEVRGEPAKEPAKEPVKAEVKQEQKPEVKAEPAKEEPKNGLDKAFEAQQDKKNDAAKEKKEAAKQDSKQEPENEVPEDELQVLPHDKPKTAKRIQALLKKIDTINNTYAETKKEAEAKAAKLAELETQLSSVKKVDPATDEAVKKQLDELAMYRRRYDLETDPAIKDKFDTRVAQAEESIYSTLKANNASDALIDLIKKEGGWNAFANSQKQISIKGGKDYVSTELAEEIMNLLPMTDRKAVEAYMMEQIHTKREKERFFKEEQAKATEYFTKREEESKKLSEAQRNQVAEAQKAIDNWRSGIEKSDWLKDKEVPANATDEQKEEVKHWNEFNKQMKQVMNKALTSNDLPTLLDVVQDSVKYHAERRNAAMLQKEVERLKAQVDAKEKEITKIKNSGRSVPRGGSISVSQQAPSAESRRPKSLEEAFDMQARGESLTGDE